ncbi:MAG: cobalamin-independent methionine synthase II family protein [Chloroflexi bacterium]|nr:cobalamin-independent methionine synthase II family protein [Chloroflexota bacterium]
MAGKELARVRSDHTGALRRPAGWRELFADHYDKKIDDEQLEVGLARIIADVIRKQEDIGLPVVTDGELRRFAGFQQSFGGAVTGFDALPYVPARPADGQRAQASGPAHRVESGVEGPGTAIYNRLPVKHRLEFVRNLLAEEYAFASKAASRAVKVTLTGPDRISQRFQWEKSQPIYRDLDDFVADVVAIQKRMIGEVVSLGCRYIQLDEPGFTAYVDPPLLERMRSRGEDPDGNLARSIAADNDIFAAFPEVTFAVHICRGMGGGRGGPGWHREGSYDAIAERLFTQLNCDRFLLEYDSEAAGTFEALRFMPKNKMAVLGLVSNHGDVETADYLKSRLDEASKYVSLDHAAICPRCGLSGLDDQTQWGKLRVIQQVADEVWRA